MNYLIWITVVVFGGYGIPLIPADITRILIIPLVFIAMLHFNANTERKLWKNITCFAVFAVITAIFHHSATVFLLGCAGIALFYFRGAYVYFILPCLILIERTAHSIISGSYYLFFGGISECINKFFTEVCSIPIETSFSFWGIHFLALLFFIQVFTRARRGWIILLATTIVQILLVAIFHSYLFSSHNHASFFTIKNAAILQVIPELLFLGAATLLFSWSSKVVHLSGNRIIFSSILCLLCGLTLILSYNYSLATGKIKKATFYANGLMDFNVPNDNMLGTGKTGMFGLFKLGLEKSGIQVDVQDYFPKTREDSDLLVIINPTSLPEGGSEALQSYLKSGGNVLVLGDHTDISGSMAVLNELLLPLGLEFYFDSGFPLSRSWKSTYENFDHYRALNGDKLNIVSRLSTGATLGVHSPLWEIVVSGRYFFGDNGNRLNTENAFLGDYSYQRGERVGDLPLVVQRAYGHGKVIVFGDTSTFQNVAISDGWPFISEIMTKFEDSKEFMSMFYLTSAMLLLNLCICWELHCPVVVMVVLAILNVFNYYQVGNLSFAPPAFPDIPKVAILKGMQNRFTEDYWEPNSVMGVCISTYRAGLWPFKSKSMEDALSIPDVKAFIFIEPIRPFSKSEIKKILEIGISHPGAVVIFSIGPNSYAANRKFYDTIGVRVKDMVLGTVPIHDKKKMRDFIIQAYKEIQFSRAFPLELKNEREWEVLYRYLDYPLIIQRNINNACFVIISDPEFLWDRTLESEMEGWPANIKFYKNILKEKP
ncbi:hypothetical protein [Akkermansia sp. AKK6]